MVWLCRAWKVSRASIYRWRKPAKLSPPVRHEELVTAVTGLCMTLLMNASGTKVSAPTVGAIMPENRLRAVRTRTWKQITVQDPQAKNAHIENHMLD